MYESMNKVAEAQEKTKIHSSVNFEELFFSKSARMLAYNTVPTVYEGEGVTGIAFDENARYLTTESLNKGLILDISAAIILTERGIDVGLRGFECYDNGQAKAVDTDVYEHFLHNGNRIHLLGCEVYHIKVDSKAEILSDIQGAMGKIPVSYRYENGQGNRFLVLNVNSRNPYPNILYHYERSRQLSENIPWLSGEKLPAYVYGNPALYLQCKKNADAMAVGLWNFYADTAIEPEVFLDREYSSIKFINCNGKLEKDRVYLTDIEPFGFVGFEVK